MEQWLSIRSNCADHLRFLFRQHANLFRVVAEAQFANDLGASDKDAVLLQIDRVSLDDFTRRPARFFRRNEVIISTQSTAPDASSLSPRSTGTAGSLATIQTDPMHLMQSYNIPNTNQDMQLSSSGMGGNPSNQLQGGNLNKEAVAELINKKGFTNALLEINPKLTSEEVCKCFISFIQFQ